MGRIADISSAESIYFPVGFAGVIDDVTVVIDGPITSADAIIEVFNSGSSSAGTITIAFSGSSAGDVDTLTPASNNTFTADSFFRISTNGGSTGAVTATIMVEVTMT